MTSSPDGLKIGLGLISFGCVLFYKGLKALKLRRKTVDIPRSRIGSAAIGSFVEVHGKILVDKWLTIKSPLTGKTGSAFIWKLEVRGRKNHWVPLHTFYSSPFLYIHDQKNHLAALDLACCEFQEDIFEKTVTFNSRSFKLPEEAKKILSIQNMIDLNKKDFFLPDEYRIKEKMFKGGELLYVLGTTTTPPDDEASRESDKNVKFGSRDMTLDGKVEVVFEHAKNDQNIISQYDKNRNNALDMQERKKLYEDIEKELLTNFQNNNSNEYLRNCKICFTKSDHNKSYFDTQKVVVSLSSEKRLQNKLLLKSLSFSLGGPVLFLAGLWFLNKLIEG